jgi:MATE family multidrug resistance protein
VLPPKDRLKRVMGLALPIMGGMVSQNVMNLVDTGMVGQLGKASLAAVGIASFATFLSQAFLMGLSSGVQAMASRRQGEGRRDCTAVPLNGGLLLAIGAAIPLSAVLFFAAPHLFPFLNDDPEVGAAGVPNWQTRILGIAAVASNFCFRGYWNGVDLSKLYLRTLVQMHAVNLFLNYVLIFGKLGFPELGATGAAIGTTVSTYVGTGTYIVLALHHARERGFLRGLPDKETVRTMLKLSVPNGIQQVFFAGGLTCLFWIIGKVGTAELAAANVLINVNLVGLLPALGLGLAATSLVGQALGRNDPEDARRWGWDVVRVGFLILCVIAAPMIAFPHAILELFIGDDPHVVEVGALPLRLAGLGLLFESVGMVLMNALFGAGDTKRVAAIATSIQWLVMLPLIYLMGPVLGFGLVGIWLVQGGGRALQALVFARLWQGDRWQKIAV